MNSDQELRPLLPQDYTADALTPANETTHFSLRPSEIEALLRQIISIANSPNRLESQPDSSDSPAMVSFTLACRLEELRQNISQRRDYLEQIEDAEIICGRCITIRGVRTMDKYYTGALFLFLLVGIYQLWSAALHPPSGSV